MDASGDGDYCSSEWGVVLTIASACYLLWKRSVRTETAAQASAERVAEAHAQRTAGWLRTTAAMAAERDAALAGALAVERERDDALAGAAAVERERDDAFKLVRRVHLQLSALASQVAVLRCEHARTADELARVQSVAATRLPSAGQDEEPAGGGGGSRRRRRRYQQA